MLCELDDDGHAAIVHDFWTFEIRQLVHQVAVHQAHHDEVAAVIQRLCSCARRTGLTARCGPTKKGAKGSGTRRRKVAGTWHREPRIVQHSHEGVFLANTARRGELLQGIFLHCGHMRQLPTAVQSLHASLTYFNRGQARQVEPRGVRSMLVVVARVANVAERRASQPLEFADDGHPGFIGGKVNVCLLADANPTAERGERAAHRNRVQREVVVALVRQPVAVVCAQTGGVGEVTPPLAPPPSS